MRLPSLKKKAGFSLIEVMVALVVLSISLLGVAALQIKSLQSTHAAYQRTVASVIAQDASERLWMALAKGAINTSTIQTAWLDTWQASNVTLPGLQGSIVRNGNVYTVTVTWNESRFSGEGTGVSFVYITRMLPDA